jgi:hypothetical protein
MRGCWLVSYGPVAVDMVISVLIHDVQIDNFEYRISQPIRRTAFFSLEILEKK